MLLDLIVHRSEQERTRRSAIIWSVIWVGAGLLFDVFVWIAFGAQAAQEYLAAYLIEKCLSLNNLFVFLLIFQTLKIPASNQRRVLFWGILGALVFRGLFILAGVRSRVRSGFLTSSVRSCFTPPWQSGAKTQPGSARAN